jgi:CRP-like cAMP-binding protein
MGAGDTIVFYAQPAMSQPPAARPPGVCCNASCRHASACEATRGGQPELLEVRDVVERAGPFSDGDRLVQPDSPHRAAFAVLSGCAKTMVNGRVTAFHLPGELFALDVARSQTHDASVMALGKTWFCRFPRDATDAVCAHNSEAARHWSALRRRERRGSEARLEGSAAERVRGFLADLLARRRRIEGPGSFIPLPMSREDLASYLSMSAATVTRMLAKLRAEGVIYIRVDGVSVLNEPGLSINAVSPRSSRDRVSA